MAADIPDNFAQAMVAESAANMQASNRNSRNVFDAAMGVLQVAAARNFDELGVTESRANSGLIATPIASPTTQQGG